AQYASETSSSPSKRQSRQPLVEFTILKQELERERADRMILEGMVQEHQKLIETLSLKLERQSKLILALQQSVEMFSRPQRIGTSPASSSERLHLITEPSKEDDEDEHSVGAPRKSKS